MTALLQLDDSCMGKSNRSPGRGAKVWILPLLVVAGLVLAVWQPVEMDTLLDWGERIGTSWWFLALVMLAIALLFTFGLPGSFGLWLIAPFNPPLLATILLVIASTAGALGAYRFAGSLGRDWKPSGASGKVVDLLERRGDVLTQIALRMLPGFPHSVVNFAGGVLGLKLTGFVVAVVIGLAIKWGVYATAIHGITDAVAAGDAISLVTLAPLFVLVGLALAGAWLRRRIGKDSD